MVRVYNRHNASVSGIAPKSFGLLPAEMAARFPWALSILQAAPAPAPDEEDTPQGALLSPQEAKRAIAKATTAEELESFLDDPRASIRTQAERRLERLEEELG